MSCSKNLQCIARGFAISTARQDFRHLGRAESLDGFRDGPQAFQPADRSSLDQRLGTWALMASLMLETCIDMLFWLGGNSLNDMTNLAICFPAGPKIQLQFSAHSS